MEKIPFISTTPRSSMIVHDLIFKSQEAHVSNGVRYEGVLAFRTNLGRIALVAGPRTHFAGAPGFHFRIWDLVPETRWASSAWCTKRVNNHVGTNTQSVSFGHQQS